MFDNEDPDERPSSMPPLGERPMTLPVAVMWSVLATALTILLLLLTQAINRDAATDLVNGLGCMAAGYLLCVFLMARVHAGQHELANFLGVRRTHPLLYVIAACLGVVLQIPAEVLHRFIERAWPTSQEVFLDQLATMRVDTPIRRIVLPIVIVALGPLVEEMFYRGALLRGLRRLYSPSIVVPVVAILFAAGHVDFRNFLPIFLVGLFFAQMRISSGSLLPPLIAHMCFNAVMVFELLTTGMPAEIETTPLAANWMIAGVLGSTLLFVAHQFVAKRSARAQLARQEDST